MPLVSFAIPTYNRVAFLKKAIASIESQSLQDFEIIVSNNGSTDSTREFLAGKATVKTVEQPESIPMFANWNAAPRVAEGEFIVLLTDDDLVGPGLVEAIAGVAKTFTDVGMIVFEHDIIDEHDRVLLRHRSPVEGNHPKVHAFQYFAKGVENRPCAIAMRTKLFKELGGYDEGYRLTAADSELIQRFSLRAGVFFGSDPRAKGSNRVWSGALTSQKMLSQQWMEEIQRWTVRLSSALQESGYPGDTQVVTGDLLLSNLYTAVFPTIDSKSTDLRYFFDLARTIRRVSPENSRALTLLKHPHVWRMVRRVRRTLFKSQSNVGP